MALAKKKSRSAAAKPARRLTKWVYLFSEGSAKMRDLLGGKGTNLAEITRIGIPVPDGFIVTTAACNAYLAAGGFPPGMWAQALTALRRLEKLTGKTLGDPDNPLLVSCRSGARFSMPGMMDTVLNIGLNDQVVEGLARLSGNERFAWDAYRRLVQMFGAVVLDVPDEPFEALLARYRAKRGVANDAELSAEDLAAITQEFKAIVKRSSGRDFPQEPEEQLKLATEAVFKSWSGKRAMDYRNAAGIAHDLGTAVNIMTMVFGNMGRDSGTGVVTTRNVTTGEKEIEGDFLINAQGEDVVAGMRATERIAALKRRMPRIYTQFDRICRKLEKHYREIQDVEFTIERGKLWILQTRDAKRTAQAAVRIAVNLAEEKLISRSEALLRVTPGHVGYFLHPQFDPKEKRAAVARGDRLASGLNVSPGAASGVLAFDADTAERWGANEKKAVIMVRRETKPDDVHGLLAARGILTSHGGRTSHAALVARQFGKPAVVGVDSLDIDAEARTFRVGQREFREGDLVSIDGTSGELFVGELKTVVPDFKDPHLLKLLKWADKVRRLGVWANADYPADAERARAYGAEGIGLCRTEHMFFESERLPYVQQMILARTDEERAGPLAKLLPFQRKDFAGLFRAMDGLPVTIRLIDPPLHEFLPDHDELLRSVAELETRLSDLKDRMVALSERIADSRRMLKEIDAIRSGKGPALGSGVPSHEEQVRTIGEFEARLRSYETEVAKASVALAQKQKMLTAVEDTREENPMLGLRGVRLGIHLPALIRMQVRAIFEAACQCARKGIKVHPKIMIPLTVHTNELKTQEAILRDEASKVMAEKRTTVRYQFGTMIEIPRAALTADRIAEFAEFFSFGTNDLTQTTFGISRDDAETGFLLDYLAKGILPENPFASIDENGVGKLMQLAVKLGRETRPDLEIGVCGEHGGDPKSIAFCHRSGLNYVSCSPFRIPIARLAAAHAALKQGDGGQR